MVSQRKKLEELHTNLNYTGEYIIYGLKGIGELLSRVGKNNEECSLSDVDLCRIGTLICDLANTLERCQLIESSTRIRFMENK
jgi:hypothetical protein